MSRVPLPEYGEVCENSGTNKRVVLIRPLKDPAGDQCSDVSQTPGSPCSSFLVPGRSCWFPVVPRGAVYVPVVLLITWPSVFFFFLEGSFYFANSIICLEQVRAAAKRAAAQPSVAERERETVGKNSVYNQPELADCPRWFWFYLVSVESK